MTIEEKLDLIVDFLKKADKQIEDLKARILNIENLEKSRATLREKADFKLHNW